MESNRDVQEFIPRDASAKERHLREIYERSQREVQRNAEFARMKRELSAALSENAVLKRAKKDQSAHVVVDKVERERAEWVLTYGGQIKEWS